MEEGGQDACHHISGHCGDRSGSASAVDYPSMEEVEKISHLPGHVSDGKIGALE